MKRFPTKTSLGLLVRAALTWNMEPMKLEYIVKCISNVFHLTWEGMYVMWFKIMVMGCIMFILYTLYNAAHCLGEIKEFLGGIDI